MYNQSSLHKIIVCWYHSLKQNGVFHYYACCGGWDQRYSMYVCMYDFTQYLFQVELHVTITPHYIKASILLNKLRLMGIFDLILKLKRFVFDKDDQLAEEDEEDWEGGGVWGWEWEGEEEGGGGGEREVVWEWEGRWREGVLSQCSIGYSLNNLCFLTVKL